MPTYKFHCSECNEKWTERQPLLMDGAEHTSKCPKCDKECRNIALGGTGFQFAGRGMNKQLEGFPDYTDKINKGAMEDAEQAERVHDARQKEQIKNKNKK